jgi:hypothetical protein
MAGTVAYYILITITDGLSSETIIFIMEDITVAREKWELIIFFAMGIAFGYLAKLYLLFIQLLYSKFSKPINANHQVLLVVVVALVAAIIELAIGSFNRDHYGLKDTIRDVLTDGSFTEMHRFNIPKSLGLFIYLVSYSFLTAFSMQCVVPAG